MTNKNHLKILFIGNSHTYYHNLPAWVAQIASEEGYECDVTMLAHPGWYLHQHVKEPEARFNIKYGHYDYVVLQEHSHPFDDIPGYIEAAATLAGRIREAGSKPVVYGTWARKTEKSVQETMNKVNRQLAQDLDALYAGMHSTQQLGKPGGHTKRAIIRSKCMIRTEHMLPSMELNLPRRSYGEL